MGVVIETRHTHINDLLSINYSCAKFFLLICRVSAARLQNGSYVNVAPRERNAIVYVKYREQYHKHTGELQKMLLECTFGKACFGAKRD